MLNLLWCHKAVRTVLKTVLKTDLKAGLNRTARLAVLGAAAWSALVALPHGPAHADPVQAEDTSARANAGLFQSREIRSENMQAFTKWSNLWRRFYSERQPAFRGDAQPQLGSPSQSGTQIQSGARTLPQSGSHSESDIQSQPGIQSQSGSQLPAQSVVPRGLPGAPSVRLPGKPQALRQPFGAGSDGASANAATRYGNTARASTPCPSRDIVACRQADWDAFVADMQGREPSALLEAVNLYMNRHPYILDPINWGLPDYWATPHEFFLKDGDCEDYAIAKYITLKRLGLPIEAMRLVIVQDENLNTPHAVLAVEMGGDTLVLDNQVDAIVSHTQILHYRPVYSINETAWWLHQRIR